MDIFNVLSMIGGLSLFLYGMSTMGDALSKMAGGKLEKILESEALLDVDALVNAAVESAETINIYPR